MSRTIPRSKSLYFLPWVWDGENVGDKILLLCYSAELAWRMADKTKSYISTTSCGQVKDIIFKHNSSRVVQTVPESYQFVIRRNWSGRMAEKICLAELLKISGVDPRGNDFLHNPEEAELESNGSNGCDASYFIRGK
jgi:hypothetical protein